MEETQFAKLSRKITNDFLSTIAFIDECAYKDTSKNDNDFDAKAVTDVFAKKGKICSVFAPEKVSDLNDIYSMLFKADAIVLDWRLNIIEDETTSNTDLESDTDTDDERGKYSMKVINKIVDVSEKEKVKLIVIYTGETDLGKIYDCLSTHFNSGNATQKRDNLEIIINNKKILVRAKYKEGKYSHAGDNLQKFMVKYEALPDCITNEFSSFTRGLLPNFALHAITEIRNSTSKILGVFSRELDPAFLGECSLTCVEDASSLLSEVFGTAITELIASSSIDLNELVESWIDSVPQEGKNIQLNDFSKNIEILVTADLLKNIKEGKYDNIKYDNNNKSLKAKDAQKHSTGFYCLNGESEDVSNLLFAKLTQNRDLFSTKTIAPVLTQGTVLKDEQNCYWLCISPVCDCVRIDINGRYFLFIPLKKEEGKETAVICDNSIMYPSLHPFDLKVFFFDYKNISPYNNANNKYYFVSGQHLFEWVITLKRLYAQKITEKFTSQMSRVGLNISEWLRLK